MRSSALSIAALALAVGCTAQKADDETSDGDEASGGPIWVYTYNGPANDRDVAWGVAAGAQSEIFVTGLHQTDSEGRTALWLSKLNAEGELDWTVSERDALGYDVAVSPEGEPCVAGETPAPEDTGWWVILRCFEPEHGGLLWTQGTDGHGISGTDAAGPFRAVAGTTGDLVEQGWIATYDPTGELLLEILTEEGTSASDVVVDENGHVTAIGAFLNGGDVTGAWLRRYDSAGALLWSVEGLAYAEPRGLARTARGDVAAVSLLLDEAAVLVSMHATEDGAELWRDVVEAGANSNVFRWDIAADGERNVVVAGSPEGFNTPTDLLMRKYDRAGVLVWERRRSPDADSPVEINAVTTDPEGAVIVAGQVKDPNEDWNILVAKFPP